MADRYTENVPLSVIEGGTDGELQVTFTYSPGCPAKVSGPPEHCYPAEPDEIELVSCFYLLGNGTTIPCGLADHEEEAIVEWLYEEWERPDFEADEADYRYEQMRDEQMEREFEERKGE